MPGRTFSRNFKLEVVRQLVEGHKRPAQICWEYQSADSMLSRWRKEYAERGEAAFTPMESGQPSALEVRVAELERFCGQLALETTALKKPCSVIISYKPQRAETAPDDPDDAASLPDVEPPVVPVAEHESELVLCSPSSGDHPRARGRLAVSY